MWRAKIYPQQTLRTNLYVEVRFQNGSRFRGLPNPVSIIQEFPA